MHIVSQHGSLAWTEMQRSKELMLAALHACGFGLPRLWYSAHELMNLHLHCIRSLSCLFSMPESDSVKEKSSACMPPMKFLSRLCSDYQKRLLPLDTQWAIWAVLVEIGIWRSFEMVLCCFLSSFGLNMKIQDGKTESLSNFGKLLSKNGHLELRQKSIIFTYYFLPQHK